VSRLAPGLAAAWAAGELSRLARRGGGTSLPGKVLMRVEPDAIGLLARRLRQGSVVVSATNGKTTTAAMVASVLERRGTRLVHNRAGANMAGGVASALAAAARGGGRRLEGDLGLFEVDEFWLPQLLQGLKPRAVLLANLFRDQLDRYGELETIGQRWLEATASLPAGTGLVLNADDPLVADLGRERPGVTYFGVDDDAVARPEMQHAADSKHCRRCGHPYRYEAIYLGHLGSYGCPNCGARRPEPTVRATGVELLGIRASAFTLRAPQGSARIEIPLPGLYNVYNALAAAALCLALGTPLHEVVAGLEAVAPAFGRAETLALRGRDASLLLIKNPAGANEVLRTLTLEGGDLDVFGVLNDRIADGRDVSWVWDADWEILAPRLRRMVCSGTRAAELAVRLKYAGADPAKLEVVEELEPALDRALSGGEAGTPLFVLPTYTALIELRELLTRRGEAQDYWR
jgi:UDP-N-acetylmuramyl tripeptide synthase